MLAVQVQIGLRDGVGVEVAVGSARRETFGPSRRLVDTAVDDDLSDVDVLRLQLTRHALDEAGQSHLAHGEGRGIRKSLDTRRIAGEYNSSIPGFEHPLRFRLSQQKSSTTDYIDLVLL